MVSLGAMAARHQSTRAQGVAFSRNSATSSDSPALREWRKGGQAMSKCMAGSDIPGSEHGMV